MARRMGTRHESLLLAAMLLSGPAIGAPPESDEAVPSRSAQRLVLFYDALDVGRHWIAGRHVDWRTGDPDGQPASASGRHTHCSAFVAAAAGHLGIYILRPPEHGQLLLANAQHGWLSDRGGAAGWRRIGDALAAQRAANAGYFVVASYRNHRGDRPGHIAIVRPGRKSRLVVLEEGPDLIQAATVNSTSISLRDGFAGHPHAWSDAEVAFHAHAVPAGKLPADPGGAGDAASTAAAPIHCLRCRTSAMKTTSITLADRQQP